MTVFYAIRQISTGALLPLDSMSEHSRERAWARIGFNVGWTCDTQGSLVFVTSDRQIVEELLRDAAYEPDSSDQANGFMRMNMDYDASGNPIGHSDLEIVELSAKVSGSQRDTTS